MKLTVAEIAKRLEASVEGNPQAEITFLAGIRDATPGSLTFVANPRYATDAAKTGASAVIVGTDWTQPCAATLIRVKNPDKAFAEAMAWFAPAPIVYKPGIHPSAIIGEKVKLGKDVFIGPHCVVEPEAVIGDRCIICASCYIGHKTVLGSDSRLYPHVTIREYTQIGRRTTIHNGTVIGSDGFGYTREGAVYKKIPQTGIVTIGDDVEIGANVTIDRARFGHTRIGNGVKIDNLVQVAHNVTIGDNAAIAAQVGISGSTSIGERTMLAGQVGIAGHVVIGPDVIMGAKSGIAKDARPGSFLMGAPAMPFDKFVKLNAHMMRLPKFKEKVAALEARLAALEKQLGSEK